jgi:histidyl-tRNA synthetase
VGWAMGVERVLELLKEQGVQDAPSTLDAFAIISEAAALPPALACIQTLRATGVSVQMYAGATEGTASMKTQFKKADASGARFALIFGADELAQSVVTVKALRDGNGSQVARPLGNPASWANSLQCPA